MGCTECKTAYSENAKATVGENILVALTGGFNKIEYFYKVAIHLPSFFSLVSLILHFTHKVLLFFFYFLP